jgi:nicotinate-nucleotide adenylyltransferase
MRGEPLRIGISGGTFDPVHIGHLIMAEVIREKLQLDKIIFIPSGRPPHKQGTGVSEACHRLNMVEMAVATNPNFEFSRIEIDREGYTYTVDTLEELQTYYGSEAKLFFIIGSDVLAELVTWKSYEKVFSMCEFIAVRRPCFKEETFPGLLGHLRNDLGAKIHVTDAPLIDISSTAVREKARRGSSIKYLVPENVEKYILENGLYR